MAKKAEPTFEEDIEALDGIVAQLEGGELGLDESLKRFEEGVALARKLRARLDAAQGRIEELLETGEARRRAISGCARGPSRRRASTCACAGEAPDAGSPRGAPPAG